MKYISMDYRFIWEQVQTGKLQDYHVSTKGPTGGHPHETSGHGKIYGTPIQDASCKWKLHLEGASILDHNESQLSFEIIQVFQIVSLNIGVSFLVLSSCYPSCNLDLYLSLSSRSLTSRNNYQYIFVSCIS